jgi:hypothetical protein
MVEAKCAWEVERRVGEGGGGGQKGGGRGKTVRRGLQRKKAGKLLSIDYVLTFKGCFSFLYVGQRGFDLSDMVYFFLQDSPFNFHGDVASPETCG